MVRRVAFPLLAVFLGSTLVLGLQQPPTQPPANQTPADPQQPPIFKARVNLVRVDVSVMARDDEAVEDLAAEDFEVEEDGIPQKVETLQFVKLDGQPPPGYKESLEIRSIEHAKVQAARDDVRLFAIFLDDYHVDKRPDITMPLRKALEDFVRQFQPMDLVAIMDPLTPLTHLEFTRSRDHLVERVRKFEGRRGEIFPVKSAAEEAQLKARNVWAVRGGVTLSALNALVEHLAGLREGRKSILFVSQGPPVAPAGSRMNDEMNDMRLTDVLRAANRGNVTIHALDPRPLGTGPVGGNYALRRLTDETGGRAIINTNNPREALSKVIAEASAYYLVGYTPAREAADGKFHKINVKVKRRGVRVVARQGYWAPSEKEMNPEVRPGPAPEIVNALSDLIEPADGRALELWVGAARGSDARRTHLTVTWDATGRTGAGTPTSVDVQPLEVGSGRPLAPVQSIISGLGTDAAPAVATFAVEPGPLTLQITARAKDGSVIDQWPERVTVPAVNGALALATPRFLRARSPFEMRAIETASNPAPTASRRLRKTDRVMVELEAYATSVQDVEIATELLNREGKVLLALPVPALQDNRARITLPVYSLAPGTYLLKIVAKGGGKEVSQMAPFQVVP